MNKKKENGVESCVGYAWSPLLHKGRYDVLNNNKKYLLHSKNICYRLNVDMDMNVQILPVATHLPPGYLSIQPLGLGKGVKLKLNLNNLNLI